MKHSVMYPLVAHPHNPEFVNGEALVRFARVAEAAGFRGISFTDHPAPSNKWLMAGGHDALDPFAALAFVAAATTELRLIPHVVVLPYPDQRDQVDLAGDRVDLAHTLERCDLLRDLRDPGHIGLDEHDGGDHGVTLPPAAPLAGRQADRPESLVICD